MGHECALGQARACCLAAPHHSGQPAWQAVDLQSPRRKSGKHARWSFPRALCRQLAGLSRRKGCRVGECRSLRVVHGCTGAEGPKGSNPKFAQHYVSGKVPRAHCRARFGVPIACRPVQVFGKPVRRDAFRRECRSLRGVHECTGAEGPKGSNPKFAQHSVSGNVPRAHCRARFGVPIARRPVQVLGNLFGGTLSDASVGASAGCINAPALKAPKGSNPKFAQHSGSGNPTRAHCRARCGVRFVRWPA